MADSSESGKFEELTHDYHEKYRTSGIALCISLATFASAEGWWFYSFFKNVKSASNCSQLNLWYVVIISAIILILSSFVYQFTHYHGMKHLARSFFYAYKFNFSEKKDEESNTNTQKQWESSQIYFKISDRIVAWPITLSAIINVIAAIIYIIVYEPNPIN